jgi:hypothetical protein
MSSAVKIERGICGVEEMIPISGEEKCAKQQKWRE